jgi:hypothetical protein
MDLTGATFIVGGEPLSPAKVPGIVSSGARCVSGYAFQEAGTVARGCASPNSPDDVHFFKDMMALIQFPRQVPGTSLVVDAFNFTTLLPTAPKLMLNVESDDYGVVETKACGCALESYGLTDHLRDIRSFRKLTGEGITLIGSDILHVLEEVLPARFGGSPLDYQLLEEEDKEGFTRIILIVSPEVDLVDEAAVIAAFLEELGKGDYVANLTRAFWEQANSIRVKRSEPVWTERGKLIPLRVKRWSNE